MLVTVPLDGIYLSFVPQMRADIPRSWLQFRYKAFSFIEFTFVSLDI